MTYMQKCLQHTKVSPKKTVFPDLRYWNLDLAYASSTQVTTPWKPLISVTTILRKREWGYIKSYRVRRGNQR